MRSSGAQALLRYFNYGRVSRVMPVSVVADETRSTQLYLRPGTPMRVRATLDDIPISRRLPYTERFSLAWTLGDGTWFGNHTLLLAPAGAAHAFMAYWNEGWEFRGWYVNLQEPLRRSRFGFDSADHVLDIVIERNLSTWTWKDEDELREAVALGRFTAKEADELYREGERAVAAVEARSWPFDRDWASWRPEPGWPAPVLVEGSDEP